MTKAAELWQKLGTELDSLKLTLELTHTQQMFEKNIEQLKRDPRARQRLEGIALFAQRAATIIGQIEAGGGIVRQMKATDPITKEGEEEGRVIGNHAKIGFPMFNVEVDGKIDTGATTSSLHATNVKAGNGRVSFQSELLSQNVITLPMEGTQEVHSADFGGDKRPMVRLAIQINGVQIKDILFNLNDRSKMDSKLLIGQDVLKAGNFKVDVSQDQEAPMDGEAPADAEAMPESEEIKIDETKIYEAIQLLADSNITMSDFVKYLQTEAVNRIKE
ncbi:hypothetical protein E4H12_00795 [Candidatus Thorarchaeota archaeon]|nr:MAG: hypothetical protein E4H12_00795 [Candidatus Thorarchaeota archaeon]